MHKPHELAGVAHVLYLALYETSMFVQVQLIVTLPNREKC
ncbi:hypothetical protein F0726_02461 [Acidithiobacillus caldus]|nr:hypothetical protein F0726_02461 [Acidithiobacillus caldus]